MSYLTQSNIAGNRAMYNRIAQAATVEEVEGPDGWTAHNARIWASAPGWDEAWEYALNTHPDEPDYDPGEDETVITDGMILSQVQAMIAEQAEPEAPLGEAEAKSSS